MSEQSKSQLDSQLASEQPLNSKKRRSSTDKSQQNGKKPSKKIKKQRSSSSSSQQSSSDHHHKKHKKSKSKKHKSKSKDSKHKKSKSKKKKEKKKKDKQVKKQDASSSNQEEAKQKGKSKDKDASKKLKRGPRKKSQQNMEKLLISGEDENLDIVESSNSNEKVKTELSQSKNLPKRRGRKPKQKEQPKQDNNHGQQDDFLNSVIVLDDQEQKKTRAHKLSQRAQKKVDKLTKIKQPIIKNIIITKNVQNVPVDHHFSKFNEAQVLQLGGSFYNATLTQSNIVRDDNKFFVIQILQMNYNDQEFYVYSRWGRVGVTGQISQLGPLNRQAAIRHYNQVVQNKIKIGHYKVVEMNYDEYDDPKKNQKGNKDLQIQSKLEPRLQQLIRLTFDLKMMNSHMKQIGYDEKRLPLGKLAQSSIKEGYDFLNQLLNIINDKTRQEFQRKKIINEISGKFYQTIPHDFGYMNMQTFVLDTIQKVKEKLQILESLQEIQIYTKILAQKFNNPMLNELDQKYFRLDTRIAPLTRGSETWKKLIKYVTNTHAKTHDKYELEVQDIFQLKKESDELNYKKDLSNKMLLWHGSRLTNYVGILSKGLKVAPIQAPSTGYMFGKGIYFADMVSKSANYCLATKINNIGLVLLCEVALGNMNQKWAPDFNAANLPPGRHSTKGMGQTEPSGGQMLDDVWIPNGKAGISGVVDTNLLYNQYVVYDPSQIKYRYLFRFRFHFKVTQNIIPP